MTLTLRRLTPTALVMSILPMACGSGADNTGGQDAGATMTDVRTSTAMDARVRVDAARSDAARTDASRVNAMRNDVGVVRDAGGTTMPSRTPPTGELQIFRNVEGRQCLRVETTEASADYGYLNSSPCYDAYETRWDIVPVQGMTGIYQVRSYFYSEDRDSCLGITSDNGLRGMSCDQATTRWRVAFDDTGEFQLQSATLTNTCVIAADDDWAVPGPCENNTAQYFSTRPAP